MTKELFENIISPEQLSLLVQTLNIADRSNLFDDLNISTADKTILKKQIEETKDIYLFINKPYENRSGDAALFKKLEQGVFHRKELRIIYRVHNREEAYRVKPYRIIFINENFYLACEVDRPRFQFSLYRIAQISSAEFTGKTFYQNSRIVRFIKEMQTPMAKYEDKYYEKLIDVRVRISPEKARYFKAKKHLPSQEVIAENDDDSLIVSYTVTQEKEIHDLIKRWIPYVQVIEPASLREAIRRDLVKWLEDPGG